MFIYGQHFHPSMDQPGIIANPDGCQLTRENDFPFAPGTLVSRDGFSRPVPSRASLLILHTLRLNLMTRRDPPDFRDGVHLFLPPTAIGSVPSLSGHAIAYR